jgi:hypothetical protein
MGKKNNHKSKKNTTSVDKISKNVVKINEEKVINDESIIADNSISTNNKIINDIITETDDNITNSLIDNKIDINNTKVENIKDEIIESKSNESKTELIDGKEIVLIDVEEDGKDIKLEEVGDSFIKVDLNENNLKQLMKNKDKSEYDFNSIELLKILNGDIEEQNRNDELNINTSNKFLQKLQNLLPTSDNIADIYSSKVVPVTDGNNFSTNFAESSSVDLISVARIKQRRISVTSSICFKEDCNNNHFNHSGFCLLHDNKVSSDDVFFSRYNSLRTSFEEDIFYKGPFVDIDGKKVKLDTIYNMKAEILRKKSLMKAITVEREDNFSQLRNQFNKLDIDNDGVVSISDLKFMINKVDPTYASTISEDVLDEKCKQMIKETVNNIDKSNENPIQITYENYVQELQRIREKEEDSVSASELTSTCFWDLRLAYLTIPDVTSLHTCCIHKRGYLLVPESLNGWKERYSCINGFNQIEFYAQIDHTGNNISIFLFFFLFFLLI